MAQLVAADQLICLALLLKYRPHKTTKYRMRRYSGSWIAGLLSNEVWVLLRMLADAEEDVKHRRVAPIQESFDKLRTSLQQRRDWWATRSWTDKAEDQLRDIIFYIADESCSVDVALSYLDKIETAINSLREFPEPGSIPRYSILKKQGYMVVVERHLIFTRWMGRRCQLLPMLLWMGDANIGIRSRFWIPYMRICPSLTCTT